MRTAGSTGRWKFAFLSETNEKAVVIKTAALTPKRARWKRGNFKLVMAKPINALPFNMSLVIVRIFSKRNFIRDIPSLEGWRDKSIQATLINHYSISAAPCLGVLSSPTCGLVNQL